MDFENTTKVIMVIDKLIFYQTHISADFLVQFKLTFGKIYAHFVEYVFIKIETALRYSRIKLLLISQESLLFALIFQFFRIARRSHLKFVQLNGFLEQRKKSVDFVGKALHIF